MDRQSFRSLFTKESLLSFQGTTAVTLLVPNVLSYLIGPSFQPYEKWAGFLIAHFLALLIAYQVSDRDLTTWVLAVMNGFLIYGSAVGLSVALGSWGNQIPMIPEQNPPGFFNNWFLNSPN